MHTKAPGSITSQKAMGNPHRSWTPCKSTVLAELIPEQHSACGLPPHHSTSTATPASLPCDAAEPLTPCARLCPVLSALGDLPDHHEHSSPTLDQSNSNEHFMALLHACPGHPKSCCSLSPLIHI